MAFTWTAGNDPLSTGDTIEADTFNEIHGHHEDLVYEMGIASYGWIELVLPLLPGDTIEAADLNEIRDAIDYLDDNNYCQTYNATEYDTADEGDDTTVNGTNYGTYKGTEDTSALSGEDGSYNGTYNSDVEGSEDTGIQNTDDNGYNYTEEGSFYNNRNFNDLSGYVSSYVHNNNFSQYDPRDSNVT